MSSLHAKASRRTPGPKPRTLLDLFATCGRALVDARNRLRVADGALCASDVAKVRTEIVVVGDLIAETLGALSELIVAFNREAALSRQAGPASSTNVKRTSTKTPPLAPRHAARKSPSTLYADAEIEYARRLIAKLEPLVAVTRALELSGVAMAPVVVVDAEAVTS